MARRIEVDERRARLGWRHHLAPEAVAADVADAARGVVALHATDPASVFLSASVRTGGADVAAIERALYDERTVVRMLGMRRTIFVVPVELVGVVQGACLADIEARERRKTLQWLVDAEVAEDAAGWLGDAEEATVAALVARGSASATELSAEVPALRLQIPVGVGSKYEATISASSRVLFLLGAAGRIVRGRPRGSWVATQYRWSPVETWVAGEVEEVPTSQARAELVRRWLGAFGPGTLADLRWWTGWGAKVVAAAVAEVGAVEVALDEGPGLVLPDDLERVEAPDPWVALLPALDPTPMGWFERDWYLGRHREALFDRTGNVGPTVWADGAVVGGWAQRRSGEVVVRLLEEVGAGAAEAIEAEAARLTAWLDPTVVTPKFRTPLDRELTS